MSGREPWFPSLQAQDPFAKGGNRHRFWWADSTYIAPGLHFRRVRIVAWPFSVWWRFRRISWWWPGGWR